MILLIDNYDSFTYNLFHYLGELGEDVRVILNDKVTLDEIESLAPEKIVISPGPCTPKEAGKVPLTFLSPVSQPEQSQAHPKSGPWRS